MSLYKKGVPMSRYRSKPGHTELINAPFSEDQVEALNAWQEARLVTPYLCPKYHVGPDDRVLIATRKGWVCSDTACDYTQNWAHGFMAERSVLTVMKEASKNMLTEGQWLVQARAKLGRSVGA